MNQNCSKDYANDSPSQLSKDDNNHPPKRSRPNRLKKWKQRNKKRQRTQGRSRLTTKSCLNKADTGTDTDQARTSLDAGNVSSNRMTTQQRPDRELCQKWKGSQSLRSAEDPALSHGTDKQILRRSWGRPQTSTSPMLPTDEQEWPPLSRTREMGTTKYYEPELHAVCIQNESNGHIPSLGNDARRKTNGKTPRKFDITACMSATQPDSASALDLPATGGLESGLFQSDSKERKGADKCTSRGSSGKGKLQSAKFNRRLFGNESGKSKREMLKDRLCQKRQEGGLSCTKRNSDKSNRAPQESPADQSTDSPRDNYNKTWKIDKMTDVSLLQPATSRDEFPLRQLCNRKKTKLNTKRKDFVNSESFVHAPSTSKRLGSTLQGKSQLDLSEHLSSMSLQSPQDSKRESRCKDHKKLWKKRAKCESSQRRSNSCRSKPGESSHSKDSSRKARGEQSENTQLKVSKRYRALTRGNPDT